MKRKFKALTLLSGLIAVAPIAAVISCGDGKAKDEKAGIRNNFAKNNPFNLSTTTTAGTESSATNSMGQAVESSIEPSALSRSKTWSAGRTDDIRRSAGESSALTERISTGRPLHPGIMWNDLWNWNPIASKDGSLDNPDVARRLDYLNAPGYTGARPQIDNVWGLTDKKFLRASVRKPVAREFGEEMVPSQSTLAPYWESRTFNRIGAPTGMVPGVNNGTQFVFQNSFQYNQAHMQWTHSDQWSIWEVMWPTADYIDLAHRNGVPVLGLGWVMANGFSRPDVMNMLSKPGPNKDYPIAKGLVEIANYIGFDGWWFDWEDGGSVSDKPTFIKALMSYAKTDKYTTVDGKLVDLAVENADARRQYNYGHREQIIAQYGPGTSTFGEHGDHFMAYQNHGQTKTAQFQSSYADITSHTARHDRFWSGSASNHDEDGTEQSLAHHWDYYKVTDKYHHQNHPTPAQLTRADLNTRMNSSIWYHNFSMEVVKETTEIYHTYTGDPRVVPQTEDKLSIGNLYRERTPIVGRKPFASNFSIGKGSHFNLWGSNDLLDYTQGAGVDGWKHQGIQDVLPTYNWIIDYLDASGVQTNDPMHPTYTSNGKVQRPTELVYNYNADKAWYGGTTLSITGDLPKDESMVSKLYASRTQLKTGDKISFKVRNNWKNPADRVLPQLALWTTNQAVPTQQFYDSNGTTVNVPKEGNYKLGWDNTSVNAWDKTPELLKYQKAPIDDVQDADKTRTILETTDATVTDVNADWIDVTYTVPATLDGKTMIDFGFAAKSKGAKTLEKLSLGQISYKPVDATPVTIDDIKNIKTDDVFKGPVTRARISWDTMKNSTDILESDKVRHYITFLLDENGNKQSVAWIGSTSAAYIDLIDRTKEKQNIQIVAVNENYEAIFEKKAVIKLTAPQG